MYPYLVALHIIFIVTWFSGMFYIVRLFIYIEEANNKPLVEKEIIQKQLKLMAKRLWYGITWPSAILTLIFGPLVLWQGGWLNSFGSQHWLHIKLAFVVLLYVYFYSLHRIFRQQQNDIFKISAQKLRIWNELATIFLVAIVMLAVVKQSFSWIWGLVGLTVFVILLMTAIKFYKRLRERKTR